MQVRDGMSTMVLTVGPGHTLRQAATLMAERRVGAAVVLDPEAAGPGILTERDVLDSIGAGQDPDTEQVGDHLTARPRVRRARLVARGGRRGDGPRRLPPPGRHRGRRGRRRALGARRRALLDGRRGDLRRPGAASLAV